MAHIDTGGDKQSRNIDLNIIPFIDLMSCLTAFLLVTAVWIHQAQLPIEPAGRAQQGPACDDGDCEKPKLSVLVEPDEIWVGVSRLEEYERIPRAGADHDWAKLEERLKAHKASVYFSDETRIEVAAESTAAAPINYQTLIATMDVAMKTGFSNVGLTEPASLSARPRM